MNRCVLHKMNEAAVFAEDKLIAVGEIADTYSYAPIKAALNFGFLQRKEYIAFLEKQGYVLVDARTEEMDKTYIEECEVSHMNSFLYLPLRKLSTGELLIAVADPFDEKLVISLTVKFKCPLKFVATSDLDITWMAHTIRGGFFVKEAVFSLMKKDP